MLVWGGDGDTELIVIWLIVENEKKLFQIRTIIGSCHIINTAWKVSISGEILVCISRIRTEYGENTVVAQG